ncbi:8661_t:CDS:2 [Scutellospora calospora]|uniref:8661_t:CDS:1 n=1 Tax=Scutellospora calospora TaxID=85575 RepID=A0ACA9KH41_9GLOM|nr:8661_t:CDS:2 [Scutellospora calospora]
MYLQYSVTTAPNLLVCYHSVGNTYFSCFQSNELEREFKDSSHKRILYYNCSGKISIKIDILITTPNEIKQEISKNLHLNSMELRYHLRKKFNISTITSKQIYYWWSYYTQQFYKNDDNYIISACMFFDWQLDNYCALCFQLETNNTTAIGFMTSLFEQSHYEEQGLRTEALTSFFQSLCSKGLNPIYFYTNKDFTEITAAKNLCLWHIEKAIKEKFKSRKKIECINYNYEEVIKEFSFIDPLFIPDLQRMDNEYYKVCSPDLCETVIEMTIFDP